MAQRFDVKLWVKQSLPQEHGSWAFVIEPLLISWIAGGSKSGLAAIGFFLAFLGYRPALIGLKDLLRKKSYPRTWPSMWAGAIFCCGGGLLMAASRSWALIGCLAILGGAFVWYDAQADRRSVLREGFGALLAVPAACLVAPGAVVVLILRPIASVLSVRGLIARQRDSTICRWLGVGAGFALIPIAFFEFGSMGWRFAAYCVCAARALYSALSAGREVKPLRIGIAEIVVSAAVVLGWLGDVSFAGPVLRR